MSTPPGKPQGASPVSSGAEPPSTKDDQDKETKSGKFGHRETGHSDQPVTSSVSAPVSAHRPGSRRRKPRPVPLTEVEERLWSSPQSSGQEDETPSLERSMTMTSPKGDSGSLPRPGQRSRSRTISGPEPFQMSDADATQLLAEFQQQAGTSNPLEAGKIIHQMCCDDEPATLDEMTRLQSSDLPGALPQIRVTPFEFDTLLRFTDLENPKSPLRQAIAEYFGCPFDSIPAYELDRIYQHCRNMLSSVSFKVTPNESAAKDFLIACLQDYLPEVSCRLPSCAECRSSSEKLLKASQLLEHIGLPHSHHTAGLAEAIENAIGLLNNPLYGDISKYGYDSLLAETEMLRKQLEASYKLTPPEVRSKLSALDEDIKELQSDLSRLSGQVRLLKDNDFRSRANNQNSINMLFYAALDVLSSPENEDQQKARTTLEQLHVKAMKKADFWPDAIPRLLGCQQLILETLKSVGLDRQFHDALIKQLQNSQADGVTKQIVLKMAGQDYSGEVSFRPAASVRIEPPEPEDELDVLHQEASGSRGFAPFEEDYKNQFCPSMNRGEKDHCVALGLVEMKIDGEKVYDEIRAGVPYAYAVADEAERTETTRKRWHEVFTAALVQKHSAELREAMANPGSHPPIELPLLYDCLLSPDMLRSFIQDKVLGSETLQAVAGKLSGVEKLQSKARDVNDDELGWSRKMSEQIQQMNGREITLKVRDSKGQIYPVKIRPKLFMAITPCNELVFGGGLLAKSKAWVFADHTTGEAIKELLGDPDPASPVGGYARKVMSRLNPQSARYREIEELAFMVRTIFKAKLHHTLTNEPMYFSNLLTELGRMLGTANLIGCKSAKDRTGNKSQSDMKFALQCKLARDQFDAGKPYKILPGMGRRITWEDVFNACQLALNSGQTEGQAKSTGIPGYKMKGYMLGYADIVFDALNRKVKPNTKWLLQD